MTSSLVITIELVPCAAHAERVRIAARHPDASQAVEREISLADVADEARPRALALAVAELVRWTGPEHQAQTPPASTASPEPLRLPPPSPVPARAPALAFAVHLEAEGRGMPLRDTLLWGGRLRITARRPVFQGALDFGANYSRVQRELGNLFIRSASAGVGFGPSIETRAAILDLGLRGELGWAWASGQTTLPNVRTRAGSDLISTLGLRASLEAQPGRMTRSVFAVEGGGVVRSLTAEVEGRPAAGIAGYYVLGAAGVVVSL